MRKSTLGLMALGFTLAIADLPPGGMLVGGASLMKQAHAVVGRPLTPVSVAGVARRTTRRIVMTTTYVAVLPPACTVVVIEGTTLHQCGATFYQPSGTQYVVVKVE
jgi:hypothetical protein